MSRLIAPKRSRVQQQLTDKQRMFVVAYFADNKMNATQAADAAGYGCPGKAGGKLLATATIQRAIGVELRKRLENNEITASRVLRELGHIAFLDPREMFNEDDSLKQIRSMPEHVRRCIAGIEIKQVKIKKVKDEEGNDILLETSIVKIKLWPKTNALELVAKHLGMLDERFKVEHGVNPESRAILKALLARLEASPSPVIDDKYIEHASTINGKVVPDTTTQVDDIEADDEAKE